MPITPSEAEALEVLIQRFGAARESRATFPSEGASRDQAERGVIRAAAAVAIYIRQLTADPTTKEA
ncbi:hypothetical protein ASF48_05065 [Rathayibacter sp. Leaf299]|uniref:hypothetical protein n=1 Tax=Rathayibacter sp. Leaf299 TaxID=1736328 RepID=UPI0006FDB233|nr:hypothetical protein [Rathayibacter sp. Leaf299]KQQ22556.1 hypothetical protein ASF48_05065 [Rathayibacter sp. Leaf299]